MTPRVQFASFMEPSAGGTHFKVKRSLHRSKRAIFYYSTGAFDVTRSFTGLALIAAIIVSLAGCGRDPGTRAVSGGLIGAGGGAALGAATGGNAGTGALIGGVVGAVGGAATTPR